jgi:hypothetical protein
MQTFKARVLLAVLSEHRYTRGLTDAALVSPTR